MVTVNSTIAMNVGRIMLRIKDLAKDDFGDIGLSFLWWFISGK